MAIKRKVKSVGKISGVYLKRLEKAESESYHKQVELALMTVFLLLVLIAIPI